MWGLQDNSRRLLDGLLDAPAPCPVGTRQIQDGLEWKCADCGVTAAPTSYDYMKLLKHQKGHHIELVNKVTGEVIAKSPKGARAKGIEPSGNKHGLELTEDGITLPVT